MKFISSPINKKKKEKITLKSSSGEHLNFWLIFQFYFKLILKTMTTRQEQAANNVKAH